jgi:hypothetical protein
MDRNTCHVIGLMKGIIIKFHENTFIYSSCAYGWTVMTSALKTEYTLGVISSGICFLCSRLIGHALL